MSTIYDRAVRVLYPMLGGRKALGETIASPTPEGGVSYYCGGPERRCSHLVCAVVSAIADADLLNYGPADEAPPAMSGAAWPPGAQSGARVVVDGARTVMYRADGSIAYDTGGETE